MSSRKGKYRHHPPPRVEAPSGLTVVDAEDRCGDCSRPRRSCVCDPTSGRYGNEAGAAARVKARPWNWLPDGQRPELGVRDTTGKGFTTAHCGTVGAPVESPGERIMRQAHLDLDERAAFDLMADNIRDTNLAPGTHSKIAFALGWTLSRARRVVESVRRKVREMEVAA